MKKAVLLSGVAMAVLTISSPSHAQQATTGGVGTAGVAEVVVTAERRSVNVQKTPVSIVALSGATLKARNITDLNSLQSEAPSISFVDNGNTKYINIRGVGMDESAPNQTNGVAVNYDGAYVAREFNLNDPYFDLADVEVLRGPQGTYQGQNAEGGAIYVNSNAPKLGEKTASVDAGYANYNHYNVGVTANMPLTSELAARVSVYGEKRDSFTHNYGAYGSNSPLQTDNQPGNLGRIFAREQLLYQPSGDLKFRLIAQQSDYITDGPAWHNYTLPFGQDPWNISYDTPQKLDIYTQRETGIVDWTGADYFTVHGVLAYQSSNQQLHQDTDFGSPFVTPSLPQSTNDIHIQDHYATGEVDVLSKNLSRIDWTVGGTFLDYTQSGLIHGTNYNNTTPPVDYSNPTTGLVIYIHTPRDNAAAFAEGGYKITDDLELKVGGRYNYDHVGFDPGTYIAPGGPLSSFHINLAPPYQNFNTFTGRALLSWNVDPNNNLYVSVSRGYKPGGTTPFADNYQSEYVLNTEVGWKGSLFDNTVRPSISLYNMDYKNFQATVATDPNDPALNQTLNVTGTTIRGIDAQINARLQNWVLDGSFSVLDTKFGNQPVLMPAGAVGNAAPYLFNLNGRPLDYAPKFSGSAGVAYNYELADGTLTPSARIKYQGSQWAYFYETPYDQIPAHTLLDLQLAYQDNANWNVAVYANNIANKVYIANVVQSTSPSSAGYLLGAPREYGVKFGYSF